jgi:hypothetical protein
MQILMTNLGKKGNDYLVSKIPIWIGMTGRVTSTTAPM